MLGLNKKKRYSIFLLRISGFVILLVVLRKVDLSLIFERFREFRWYRVGFVYLLFFCIFTLKSIRWKILLSQLKINVPLRKLAGSYVASFLPGAITPGRFGEFIRFKMLDRSSLKDVTSLTIITLDRLWDIAFVSSIAVIFLFSFWEVNIALLILPLIAVISGILFYPGRVIGWVQNVLNRHVPRITLFHFTDMDIKYLEKMKLSVNLKCFLITVMSWGIYFLEIFILFRSLGALSSYCFIAGASAAASLVALIPISIAGIGVRDLTLVSIFKLSGRLPEEAIILSACILSVLVINCFLSLPFWLSETRSI